ncbi:hypothetical protein LEN26_001314 [Aphanomyces euteiches]|nr:hypothetical protein AeMF1_015950 [Aphanomyces euteiches]KAH9161705.1 hypothetical protein LEN26_001314 [Aphanomyces euteiches]KAH9197463.1 hypothetical protein AeNC1_000570 [Aphanomyces euteiches]
MKLFRGLLLGATAIVAALAGSIKEDHKITTLPNYNDKTPLDFNQYAGRLAIPSNGQEMFYWYVESQNDPKNDPIVLWLNGGPGCSSLGGFFTELGPFVVMSDLTVKRNKYGWNRKANVVFLESPSGVGFSRPVLNSSQYNDDFTTGRAREFLIEFFKAYPELQNRDFYITGESYGGMYIPFLVHNLVTTPAQGINLKGFAIGNPYTDEAIDNAAYMDYYYSHGLISIEDYNAIQANCNKTSLAKFAGVFSDNTVDDACAKAVYQGMKDSDRANFNGYYIFGDVCLLNNEQGNVLRYKNIRPMHRGNIGPCADQFTESYLRLPAVQSAIHITGNHVDWTACSSHSAIHYTRSKSSLPLYPTILSKGLKALIYSGDADSVVNFIGTQRWITTDGLKLNVKSKWRPWFGPDKQLAGYTEGYDGLNFTTIKGAGHMVPAVRPLHGLYLFECFIYGPDACAKFDYPKDNLEYLTGADVVYSADEGDNDDDVAFSVEPAVKPWHYAVWYSVLVAGTVIAVVVVNRLSNKPKYQSLTDGESKPIYTQ